MHSKQYFSITLEIEIVGQILKGGNWCTRYLFPLNNHLWFYRFIFFVKYADSNPRHIPESSKSSKLVFRFSSSLPLPSFTYEKAPKLVGEDILLVGLSTHLMQYLGNVVFNNKVKNLVLICLPQWQHVVIESSCY